MAMSTVACLSGTLARQRAKAVCASIPHYFHCSLQHVCVCADRDTNQQGFPGVTSPPAVGMCPLGGGATVFAGLTTIMTSSTFRRRKAETPMVLAVTPIRPTETLSMHAKASTPYPSNPSLKRFSPGRNARKNIAGPMRSPCWIPLEQAIVLVSRESVRKNTSASLVP